MTESFRESIAICKDLSQRTTDIQNATMKSHLQKRCSRDSSEILQKVQGGESIIFILYKDLLV